MKSIHSFIRGRRKISRKDDQTSYSQGEFFRPPPLFRSNRPCCTGCLVPVFLLIAFNIPPLFEYALWGSMRWSYGEYYAISALFGMLGLALIIFLFYAAGEVQNYSLSRGYNVDMFFRFLLLPFYAFLMIFSYGAPVILFLLLLLLWFLGPGGLTA